MIVNNFLSRTVLPCAYRAHALTTELSGQTMRCA